MKSHNNNSNLKSKLLYCLLGITFIIVTLSAYWLKSYNGIDFSEKYSLSGYFPFNHLAAKRKVIDDTAPGIIIDNSFDSFSLFTDWASLWMREKGKATKEFDTNGINNSRCLVIKSSSTKNWSCLHKNIIKVTMGDVFSFQVAAKLYGKNLVAQAGVAAFDENMSIISWDFIKERTDISNRWMLLRKTFTIPDNVFYIRFGLSGSGAGEFRFDDVYLKKFAKGST